MEVTDAARGSREQGAQRRERLARRGGAVDGEDHVALSRGRAAAAAEPPQTEITVYAPFTSMRKRPERSYENGASKAAFFASKQLLVRVVER